MFLLDFLTGEVLKKLSACGSFNMMPRPIDSQPLIQIPNVLRQVLAMPSIVNVSKSIT
jgi:hypothetical protein